MEMITFIKIINQDSFFLMDDSKHRAKSPLVRNFGKAKVPNSPQVNQNHAGLSSPPRRM